LIVAKLTCVPERRTPTLKAAALGRVRDYVAEHLGETIRVADLAALTDLSVGRFALCFQASTGVLPSRFVLSRRVEAAMGLLRDSPMVEVLNTLKIDRVFKAGYLANRQMIRPECAAGDCETRQILHGLQAKACP